MKIVIRYFFRNQNYKMAKSLRSKWKRKMRAVKRVKNLEKVFFYRRFYFLNTFFYLYQA